MKKLLLSASLLATITASAQITGTAWISTTNPSHTVLIGPDSLLMNKPLWATDLVTCNPPVWIHYRQISDELYELPGRPNLNAFIPGYKAHYTFTLLAPDTLLRHDTYNNGYYLYYRKKTKATNR